MTTLSELIELSTAFSAEVDLERDFRYNLTAPDDNINGYLPNQGSRSVMAAILNTLTGTTDRKVHLIQASFGTGKSYLLLMLAHILGNNDSRVLRTFLQKVSDKDSQYNDRLGDTLAVLTERDDGFLVVIPRYGDIDFRHALLQGLVTALDEQGIDYRPDTMYQQAAEFLEGLKTRIPAAYEQFSQKLTTKSLEAFVGLLRSFDAPTYQQFKTYYREVLGSAFAEADSSDPYKVYVETARAIVKLGFRGIVICYDELGDMLTRMINAPDGSILSVQKFLESIKTTSSGANIIFLAATHQNPESLRDSKEQDINKITGRFEMHRLGVTRSTLDEAADAEIADATEIMGTVFIHPPATKPQFDQLLDADYRVGTTLLTQKNKLYADKSDEWIEANVLCNLHPLHVLTARLLPKLSNEFAQSTRSMFNFLSPTQQEMGALHHFLKTQPIKQADGRPTVFTPDRLLDFFEPNLRDAKFNQIKNWLDDYLTAVGKVTDQRDIERLYRNILMLKVVRDNRFAPTAPLLFWAMDWSKDRRGEFDNLLQFLANENHLEYYRERGTYDFPSSGALSIDTVIKEERAELAGLPLIECLPIWESLDQRQAFNITKPQQIARYLRVIPAHRLIDIRMPVEELTKFYWGQTDTYTGSGILFYLIDASEQNLTQLIKSGVTADDFTRPYTFYATPKDLLVFATLQQKTIEFKAREAALLREEIKSNPARKDKVSAQLHNERESLKTAIKKLYEPANWNWFYAGETSAQSFSSVRHLDRWIEQKMDDLFTTVPSVKDEALEFVKRSQKKPERQNALIEIITAKPKSIVLDGPGNAAHDRIVSNFFRNLSLTSTQGGRSNGKQYGDVKSPDTTTPEGAIFKHFDKVLKTNQTAHPNDLFLPLLQAPFGLSEPLIKFFFVAYNRLNDTQISILRGTLQKDKDPALFDDLFNKPGDYRIRRVEMSGPVERYFRKLRELFKDKTASSFSELARQFQGVWSPLTTLQRTLIEQKGGDVSSFYATIDELGRQTTIAEPEAQTLFLDTLPNSLMGITSQQAFLDESANVEALIEKLRTIKEFPVVADRDFKLETLQALVREVFGQTLVGRDDIQDVVKQWFAGLPSVNRIATYENTKINDWRKSIEQGPQNRDVANFYLNDLTDNPIRDWSGILAIRQSKYVQEIESYKKTIEEFVRPVLPVYQAIARAVFEVTASECPSEAAFAGLFSNWWSKLPQLTRGHDFDDMAVVWLVENITSTAPTKQTYLDVIPRRWVEKGNLPSIVSTNWEQWSTTDIRAVASEYLRCYDHINEWKPPIDEIDFFSQIGQVFGIANVETAGELRRALNEQWLSKLPIRTQTAKWIGVTSHDGLLMTHLSEGDFFTFLTETLPHRYSLPILKEMDDDVLKVFLRKIDMLRNTVEQYRRPISEVLSALGKETFSNEAEFKNSVYDAIRRTEAFSSHAEQDSTLLGSKPLAVLMLQVVRQSQSVGQLITIFAERCDLPTDYHTWSDAQQLQFVRSFKDTKKLLIDWKFPEDRLMADAKQQLSQQVQSVGEQFNLTSAQLRKILNDVLAEQSTNVTV